MLHPQSWSKCFLHLHECLPFIDGMFGHAMTQCDIDKPFLRGCRHHLAEKWRHKAESSDRSRHKDGCLKILQKGKLRLCAVDFSGIGADIFNRKRVGQADAGNLRFSE